MPPSWCWCPGMGDDVQAIKAGIMEIADVFVINKSDQAGADRLEREIKAIQSLSTRKDGWVPPVVRTVATEGQGIERDAGRGTIVSCARRRQGSRRGELESAAARDAAGAHAGALFGFEFSGCGRRSGRAAEGSVHDHRWLARTNFSIDHLGIAVRSLDSALEFYEKQLGFGVGLRETVEQEKVKVAMLPAGGPRIELLEATEPDSVIAKFIEKRGEGLHHVAVKVPDLVATAKRLKESGARLLNDPRPGAGGHLYVFVHPASTGGVLLELIQE